MIKKYTVRFAMPVFFDVSVEAEDEDAALDEAMNYAYLSSYSGNGSMSGKLIGTDDECVYLEPGEEIIETPGWTIYVEERE